VQDKLNAQKTLLKGCNHEISEAHGEKTQLMKEISNTDLQIQELDHKVSKCNKDTNDAAKLVCKSMSCINLSRCVELLLSLPIVNIVNIGGDYVIGRSIHHSVCLCT